MALSKAMYTGKYNISVNNSEFMLKFYSIKLSLITKTTELFCFSYPNQYIIQTKKVKCFHSNAISFLFGGHAYIIEVMS